MNNKFEPRNEVIKFYHFLYLERYSYLEFLSKKYIANLIISIIENHDNPGLAHFYLGTKIGIFEGVNELHNKNFNKELIYLNQSSNLGLKKHVEIFKKVHKDFKLNVKDLDTNGITFFSEPFKVIPKKRVVYDLESKKLLDLLTQVRHYIAHYSPETKQLTIDEYISTVRDIPQLKSEMIEQLRTKYNISVNDINLEDNFYGNTNIFSCLFYLEECIYRLSKLDPQL